MHSCTVPFASKVCRQVCREERFFRSLQAVAADLMTYVTRACDARYEQLTSEPGGGELALLDTQVR